MSTTALFVELLIIGIEALIWITLLAICLFGLAWTEYLQTAFDKAGLFTTLALLSLVYVVGIVMDELSDWLISSWPERIRGSLRGTNEPDLWEMQAYVFGKSEESTTQLKYMRSRIRIVRASIFNLALITILGLAALGRYMWVIGELHTTLVWSTIVLGLAAIGLSIFVYLRITHAYWMRTKYIYKVLKAQAAEQSAKNRRRSFIRR